MSETLTKTRYGYKGKLLKLRVDRVRLPNGYKTTREIVEHPGAVAIIPVLDDARILLTRQYRRAARRHMIEIPAGTLERGESPILCAKRELIEETGYATGRIRKLFSCFLAPGYSTEKIHFFLATRLVPRKAEQPEDETITTQAVKLREGLRAIERGEIQDAKTICGLYYLATHAKQVM
jgi:ADP-ribose pyrophosphatase